MNFIQVSVLHSRNDNEVFTIRWLSRISKPPKRSAPAVCNMVSPRCALAFQHKLDSRLDTCSCNDLTSIVALTRNISKGNHAWLSLCLSARRTFCFIRWLRRTIDFATKKRSDASKRKHRTQYQYNHYQDDSDQSERANNAIKKRNHIYTNANKITQRSVASTTNAKYTMNDHDQNRACVNQSLRTQVYPSLAHFIPTPTLNPGLRNSTGHIKTQSTVSVDQIWHTKHAPKDSTGRARNLSGIRGIPREVLLHHGHQTRQRNVWAPPGMSEHAHRGNRNPPNMIWCGFYKVKAENNGTKRANTFYLWIICSLVASDGFKQFPKGFNTWSDKL